MTPENKTVVLEALRSGRYAQITGALRDTNGYCSLGVIAEALELCEWVPSVETPDRFFGRFQDEGLLLDGSLPLSVAKQLGLDAQVPIEAVAVTIRKHVPDFRWPAGTYEFTWNTALTAMNDTHRLSFNQIADVIEEYL